MNKWIVWALIAVAIWFVWKKFGGKIVSTVKSL
jgi:hypothetical protein